MRADEWISDTSQIRSMADVGLDHMTHIHLRQPLRQWRAQRLLSVHALAKLAEITPKTLIDLEYGRRLANYGTMRQISAALGVSPSDITEFAAALERRGALPSSPPDD